MKDMFKAQQDLIQKRRRGEDLIKAVVNYIGHNAHPIINKVLNERIVIDRTLKDLAQQIESTQNGCEHEMDYAYHDGHYNYYTCKKCNKIDKV